MAVRDVSRELSEFTDMTVPSDELGEALKRLEADGFVQYNERNQTIFVRTKVTH